MIQTAGDSSKVAERRQGRPNRWFQRVAVAVCVTAVALTFSYSQSDVAFAKQLSKSNGFLRFKPTAPGWMRERTPIAVGEWLGKWFDTPSDLFIGDDVSMETLKRAAEIKSLAVVVFDNHQIDERHVAAFRGHPGLKDVRLGQTDVTDDVFPILESLPRLSYVALSSTNITPQGLDAFRERHPAIKVEVDPVTASGLRLVSKGRATFGGDGVAGGTLTLRGTMDDKLLAAAKRLPIRTLVLEGIDAGPRLADLLENRKIEILQIHGGSVDGAFARAISNDRLVVLELAESELSRDVAKKLSSSPLMGISIVETAMEPKALASLLDGKRLSYLRLGRLTFSGHDVFRAEAIDHMECDDVRFTTSVRPFGPAEIQVLELSRIEITGDLLADLAAAPARVLSITAPMLRGESERSWLRDLRAEDHVGLAELALDPEDVSALAAAPVGALSFRNTTWPEDSTGCFMNAQAARISFDRLPAVLTDQLATSMVEQLHVRDAISGEAMAQLGRTPNLKRLELHVESPTQQQIGELIKAPSLQSVTLWLRSPLPLPAEAWRELAAVRPALHFSVFLEPPASNASRLTRLWPG